MNQAQFVMGQPQFAMNQNLLAMNQNQFAMNQGFLPPPQLVTAGPPVPQFHPGTQGQWQQGAALQFAPQQAQSPQMVPAQHVLGTPQFSHPAATMNQQDARQHERLNQYQSLGVASLRPSTPQQQQHPTSAPSPGAGQQLQCTLPNRSPNKWHSPNLQACLSTRQYLLVAIPSLLA
ncbi:uncharacterized protein LOC62_03G003990 [Vanrija pseudolonga]|uniref:Uncharacterized protein n=1 Tax=Vanrija pseudolonga TaxID=143232 RepID=A0AAF0YB95_9TREE|nr:hypothetical protein LOC62_03G003990 [Vanrija pseudolonga]